MARGQRGGMTVIDLMIVLTIIALLAVIAVPSFLRAGLRAKQSEAKRTLQLICEKEKAYFAAKGFYWFDFASKNRPDALEPLGIAIPKTSVYEYSVHSYKTGLGADFKERFVVRAQTIDPKGLDGDPEADSWEMDDSGNIRCISDDLKR